MSRYAGTNDLRAYMSPTGALSTDQDGLLQDCLDRAESAIDDYTRRNFVGTAGTAFYSRYTQAQTYNQALYLNQDLFSLTTLTNGDGANIPVGSVWLEPRNLGPPYRILRLKSAYVWVWNTDSDVQIVGTFGYGTVAPPDVQQATIRYAAYLFRQKDASGPTDVSGFPQAGETPVPRGMPDDVRYLLAPYRSKTGGWV